MRRCSRNIFKSSGESFFNNKKRKSPTSGTYKKKKEKMMKEANANSSIISSGNTGNYVRFIALESGKWGEPNSNTRIHLLVLHCVASCSVFIFAINRYLPVWLESFCRSVTVILSARFQAKCLECTYYIPIYTVWYQYQSVSVTGPCNLILQNYGRRFSACYTFNSQKLKCSH